MKIPLLLLPFLLAALSVSAQVNPQCPAVSVEGPMAVPQPGELIPFTVTVKPTESKLTYKWTVEYGEIVDGQGTPTIKVRSENRTPTAIVEVGGLPLECPNRASETISDDWRMIPKAEKLDTFLLPSGSESDERLKSIAAALSNNSTAQLYLLMPSNRSLWKTLGDRLYELVHSDLTGPRITFVEMNGTNKIVEVWLVPAGAAPPSKCEACDEPELPNITCPSFFVLGPAGITTPNETMTFTAAVSGGPKDVLKYNWKITAGRIESGQGTPSIVVRTPTDLKISSITATVKLTGLDATCSNTASETAPVTRGHPLELDTYGRLNRNDEKARLAIALNYIRGRSPMKAVVAVRVPGKSTVTFASRRRTIMTLLRELKSPKNRFVLIDAGTGELSTSIWIVPGEAVPAMIRGIVR